MPAKPWMFRPAFFATRSITAPVAALCIGICLPPAAHLAAAVLPFASATLVFCAVAGAEAGRPTRAEGLRAAIILWCTMLACPAVVAAAACCTGVGPEWVGVAVLLAGSPVSMSGGVVASRFGLPMRPVVWASTMSIGLAPATFPLMAALSGAHGLPQPHALATAAAGLAGLPLFAALLARRVAPARIAAVRADLRGLVVLALCILAVSAGGRTTAALLSPGGWDGCAVAVGVQVVAAATAWFIGVMATIHRQPTLAEPLTNLGFETLPLQLALASTTRNNSVAWAASMAAGGLSASAETALSTALSLTVLAPVMAFFLAARRRARPPRRPR